MSGLELFLRFLSRTEKKEGGGKAIHAKSVNNLYLEKLQGKFYRNFLSGNHSYRVQRSFYTTYYQFLRRGDQSVVPLAFSYRQLFDSPNSS